MESETPRLGLPMIAPGQAAKELTHNEALTLLDLAVLASVVSLGTNAPPDAPASGEAWIVGDAPTGVWADHAGSIAGWTAGGWRFLPAGEGMQVWVRDAGTTAVRRAGGWIVGDVACKRVVVDGLAVVGRRAAAIPDPAGGNVSDTEARAAIAAMLGALRAHGLIA